MNLAIIGGGNMGSVLARNLLDKNLVDASELLIVETSRERRMGLEHRLGCLVSESIDASLSKFSCWIIAVKPQVADKVCAQLNRYGTESTFIISIMAGVSVDWLAARLDKVQEIVRAIPNLPARVGNGSTIYFAPEWTSNSFLVEVEKIFSSCGKTFRVDDEKLVDAATAITSSGPGFIFYLFENFVEAATQLGYTREQAEELMVETFFGAVSLIRNTKIPAAMWRERVATKGGTTEAGLKSFELNNVGQKIIDGIRKAYERSLELGKRNSEEGC